MSLDSKNRINLDYLYDGIIYIKYLNVGIIGQARNCDCRLSCDCSINHVRLLVIYTIHYLLPEKVAQGGGHPTNHTKEKSYE